MSRFTLDLLLLIPNIDYLIAKNSNCTSWRDLMWREPSGSQLWWNAQDENLWNSHNCLSSKHERKMSRTCGKYFDPWPETSPKGAKKNWKPKALLDNKETHLILEIWALKIFHFVVILQTTRMLLRFTTTANLWLNLHMYMCYFSRRTSNEHVYYNRQ